MFEKNEENISYQQILSIYQSKRRKQIIELINMKNFDNMLLLENHIEKISNLLRLQGINIIAVYGMGYVGQKFIELMQNTHIEICYGIDKNSISKIEEIKVRKPENISKDMDIIVVTPELYYDEIVLLLKERVTCPIIRLSELLEEMLIYI